MDDPDTTAWVQAIDQSSGDVIGVSKWSTDYKPASARLAEKAKAEKETIQQAAEVAIEKAPTNGENEAAQDEAYINTALFEASVQQKSKIIKDIFGDRKFLHFATLAVAPKYQRNGAGKKLLHTCLKFADKEGLDVFLEASPWAEALYAKNGFDIVGQTKYETGKEKPYIQNVMVRKHR
ncbi:hypothetical protein K431DRAFT_280147 [Polychaeton citri CBS 116435]|uniref:N-acetyltransferase domain-containing protein n=1 Tax=Polychaeton citri CBS 116435 TaxID=1314669 RepID=A0A9P4QIE4_9PEZI|nr:hypothetical protein K431DRAFT_280147 [Polychaeton citri CBS 116435]